MNIKNLCYRTDCIIQEFDGTVSEEDDYFVVRTPTVPDYHWGNYLLFKKAPQAGDYDKWIEAHEKEFGTDSGHVTFGWDSQEIGDISDFEKNGFTRESGEALCFQGVPPEVETEPDFEVRKIETDEEWQTVMDLQVRTDQEESPSEGFVAFIRNLFQTYRRMNAKGWGNWYGAFCENTLIGDMGIYFDSKLEVARFQRVETHAEHRGKGVCTHLLKTVMREAISSKPDAKLVICANLNSQAGRTYSKSGFQKTELHHGVSLPRPYKNRFDR